MKNIVSLAAFVAVFVLLYVFWPEQKEEVAEQVVVPEVTEEEEQKQPGPEAWEIAGVPDFMAIKDVKQKKKKFFDYMLPLVEEENQRIIKQRNRILQLAGNISLSEHDKTWLKFIGRQYREEGEPSDKWFDDILEKVDMLPPSMALAQAANESGWGTSRFAREGNNYFGQWCFTEGCGLVPNSRKEGFTHEVKKFDDVQESVRAYLLNLNSHPQYEALRELRVNARDNNQVVTGPYLAQGLWKYSERGFDYVDEISRMMHKNNLVKLDKDAAVTLTP
ncbi:glucosaminidase domain-containing protein [Sansalvadorimonas sp. 2012CJ34-2]|uniref:Glucosaminidase domain-containing protein n=1 Tax=Parendozoicomonas callyspongiae TaxID=2942213 RepID=A0ABT0PJG9_9GAMM|nr:glucosaminidase domain-containing protein [Sansalvadorimonas sp. 2012CJ34-2]MCL6271478.1 glucosaminidase domain-containing protein [Sansalvadorimonas sp. 2012CJ34-2]